MPHSEPEPLTPEQQRAVDDAMASPELQELIASLARAMVSQVAPQELTIFDATIVADNAERTMRGQGEQPLSDD